MSESHFLHFGCWNKGQSHFISGETERETRDNTEVASNLTNVMRKLNEVTNDLNPEFIVVAGDNYYPNKITVNDDKGVETKLKLFDESDMKSGFGGLPKNVEVDVIMGNHDYETNLYVAEEDKIETSCKILKLEYELEKSIDNNLNILVNKYRKFDDKTLILMIDTTIYSHDDADAVVNCYKLHPNFKTGMIEPTIESIRQKQSEFMINTIKSNIVGLENIIIIGHHPITAYKMKQKETKLINNPGGPFVDSLYNGIFKTVVEKDKQVNYYYLCADLHQYQIGNIAIYPETNPSEKMMIKQYVVGTGGADHDPYPFKKPDDISNTKIDRTIFKNNNINYNIIYLMTPEELNLSGSMYGFLQCTSNDGRLSFKFIDVDGNRYEERNPTEGFRKLLEQQGGKRKTKKHNKKHKKLRKTLKRKKVLKSRKHNKRSLKKISKTRKY